MIKNSKPHNFGLVLSGGGVKGAFHIGVLKALQENGIKPTCVSGTSAGALAGAFWACDYDMDEVFELMTTNSFFSVRAFSWTKPGLLDTKKVLEVFCPIFEHKTFESLNTELHIVTTDIVHGREKVFNSGALLLPLLASCAFPFVLSPISIENTLYSDGGILNNFPTEIITKRAEKSLGIYLSPLREIKKEELITTIDVVDRVYRISNRYESIKKLNDCTWTINPTELKNYGTFTVSKITEIYDLGLQYGRKLIPELVKEM